MRSFPGGYIFVYLNFALELKHVCMDFFFLFFSKNSPEILHEDSIGILWVGFDALCWHAIAK